MPTNIQSARKIALSLPGVEEGTCHGTPAFYVRRKLILRLKEDGNTLVVRYPMDERDALINGVPGVFSVTNHYQNYPAVLMSLPAANQRLLTAMIEGAWRSQASRAMIAALNEIGQGKAQKIASRESED